jgi:hypothetical protein
MYPQIKTWTSNPTRLALLAVRLERPNMRLDGIHAMDTIAHAPACVSYGTPKISTGFVKGSMQNHAERMVFRTSCSSPRPSGSDPAILRRRSAKLAQALFYTLGTKSREYPQWFGVAFPESGLSSISRPQIPALFCSFVQKIKLHLRPLFLLLLKRIT